MTYRTTEVSGEINSSCVFINHIIINDCLNFHVVKIYPKVVLEFNFKLSVARVSVTCMYDFFS